MNHIKEIREANNIKQSELADYLNVSQGTLSNWERGIHDPDNESLMQIANYLNVSIDYLLGRTDMPQSRKKGVKIPVLGKIQAGIPIEAIEEIIDYEEITEELAQTGEFFGLVIRGDSMSPTLINGDIVIVKKQSDIESGEIAVVLVNGNDATCKKVIKHENGISLVPFNSAFEPMFYTNKEVCDMPIEIIGKIVESRRTFA